MDKTTQFSGLIIHSIEANAKSLLAQLQEYDHLKVTKEQYQKLNKIEKELHSLVQEITKS